MNITFKAFSQLNRARSESPNGFKHKLDSWSLSDWLTALAGEVGEAANLIKKLNRCRDGIPGNEQTATELHARLGEELADAFIYLDLLTQAAGFDLEDEVFKKFNMTSFKIGFPEKLG